MAGIDLATATANLNAWVSADLALAGGVQEYTFDVGGARRTVRRADAAEVRNNVDYWNRWVQRLSRGNGLNVREVIPR